jgi:hypothetical protein
MDLVIREPLVAYGKRKFTIEGYLEYENASEEKHEYYQGELKTVQSSIPLTEVFEGTKSKNYLMIAVPVFRVSSISINFKCSCVR